MDGTETRAREIQRDPEFTWPRPDTAWAGTWAGALSPGPRARRTPGDGEISRQSEGKEQRTAGDAGPANPHRPPAAPRPRACRPSLLDIPPPRPIIVAAPDRSHIRGRYHIISSMHIIRALAPTTQRHWAAARVLPPLEPLAFLQSNPAHRPCRRPPPRADLVDDDPSQLLAADAAKKAAEPKAAAPSPAKPASKQPAKTPPPAPISVAHGAMRFLLQRRTRGAAVGMWPAGGATWAVRDRRDHGDADANGFEDGYCLCNYMEMVPISVPSSSGLETILTTNPMYNDIQLKEVNYNATAMDESTEFLQLILSGNDEG
ncbi:hypothetical protein ZWY2020_013603 [Hordeum vulgare]|nr:hypothetical protein ZWY2020_013603 [Hordeum vulgare]